MKMLGKGPYCIPQVLCDEMLRCCSAGGALVGRLYPSDPGQAYKKTASRVSHVGVGAAALVCIVDLRSAAGPVPQPTSLTTLTSRIPRIAQVPNGRLTNGN